MTTQSPVTVYKPSDVLPALFEVAEPFDKGLFDRLQSGVYVMRRPWATKDKIPVILEYEGGKLEFVRESDGAIINLDSFQQDAFHSEMSKRNSVELTHGSFGQHVDAAFSDEGVAYKRDVLARGWVYALERIGPDGQVYQVVRRPANVVYLVNPPKLRYHLFGSDRPLLTLIRMPADTPYAFLEGPLQGCPTRRGYVGEFEGVLPQDGEIKDEIVDNRRIHWGGEYPDENNSSAVRCNWVSVVKELYVIAVPPLDRDNDGVLSTFAKAL